MNNGRLKTTTKISYGFGAISDVIMANIIFQLSGPIYVQGLHVSPVLIGLAVSIPRLWDAFTDPIMGNISDNSRFRWGRRKPFMFWGSLAAGILCALMWMPPTGLSQYGLFAYFLLISILFFTAYTVFSVPFNALGYELTGDYDQRTSVMSYKTLMMNIGSVLLLPWAFKLCTLDIFGGDEIVGARYVGALFGIMIFAAAVLTVLFAKENVEYAAQPKIKLLDAFKYTLSNKPFLSVNVIILVTLTGVFLAFPLLFYINMAYICPGDMAMTATWTGWYGTVYGMSGIILVPVINYFGQKLGKRKTLLAGLSIIIIGFMASWWLFTPTAPYLQLVFAFLVSPGLSCVFILTSSMMADVCDLDELKTGLRREGMFGAVFGFLVKLGLSLTLGLSGFILEWTGYNTEIDLQPETVSRNLRIMFALLPMTLLAISFIVVWNYSLTKERMLEVRQLLDKNKANRKI
jgi:glycoside/pentoside/hexuronide:cation symporter, GPH family